MIVFIFIIVGVIVVELIMKRKAEEKLETGRVIDCKPAPIKIQKLHNYGMANSILKSKPQIVKVIGVAIMAVLVIGFILLLPLKGRTGLKIAFALIIGGGLSNLIDRFLKGYVTDYFSFQSPFQRLNRLVFNISDMCIFIGAVIGVLAEAMRGVE